MVPLSELSTKLSQSSFVRPDFEYGINSSIVNGIQVEYFKTNLLEIIEL